MTLVSVVIPCRNKVEWIDDTLDSVLRQTHRSLEVLVVDDGSDDGSAERVAVKPDERVSLIRGSCRGACAARNAGFDAARGELIQFLDADDLLAPEKIAVQVGAWRRHGSEYVYFGPYGRFLYDPADAMFHPTPLWADMSGLDWLVQAWTSGGMMAPHSWLVPRPLAERAGPWDESLLQNQDGEYFARVLLASRGVRFCAGARSYYRCGQEGSVSARQDYAARASRLHSIESIADRLLAVENSPRVRTACSNAFEEFMFLSYPAMSDLSVRARRRMQELGGTDGSRPFRGPLFKRVSRLLGWRLARRLQTGWRRWFPRPPRHAVRWR